MVFASGEGCAVLIRALHPLECSVTAITELRQQTRKSKKTLRLKDLCSGPSKLTQAFRIDKASFNQEHICRQNDLWLEEGHTVDDENIVECSRIGIDYAEEWTNKPLRFYVRGNESVSVRNKTAEQQSSQKNS